MNTLKLNIITNGCGAFFVDEEGILQDFKPSKNNPIINDEYIIHYNYEYSTNKSICNLIVPEGVRGFRKDFLRGIRVLERFVLPDSLEEIGNYSSDFANERGCVFANCVLPKVIIPQNVKMIGCFAFGHSHIEELVLPKYNHIPLRLFEPKYIHIPNLRQFKDGYIGKLFLPIELKRAFNHGCESKDGKGIFWLHNAKLGEIIYYDKTEQMITDLMKDLEMLGMSYRIMALIRENPDKVIFTEEKCPECGGQIIKVWYRSDPMSWRMLAGRAGYVPVCRQCGKEWNLEIHIMN